MEGFFKMSKTNKRFSVKESLSKLTDRLGKLIKMSKTKRLILMTKNITKSSIKNTEIKNKEIVKCVKEKPSNSWRVNTMYE